MNDGDDDPINPQDCWEVISAYFDEKGLVRQQVRAGRADSRPCSSGSGPPTTGTAGSQDSRLSLRATCCCLMRVQLDSFDEFIMNTMQEIVDECSTLHLVPQQQHNPLMQASGARSYKIQFAQIYLSKPTWVEPDQTTSAMFPNEARLRNLTYAAPLYMDLTRTTVNVDADGEEEEEVENLSKIFLGQVGLPASHPASRACGGGV